MPTWKQLESSGKVRARKTSPQEIQTHLKAVETLLRDASLQGLSDDTRFVVAYTAAQRLSSLVLSAAGYEPHGDDHHKVTFSALPVAMGDTVTMTSDYFDRCRRKRNNIQYDAVNVATKSEADELCKKVKAFQEQVLRWLKENHANLLPQEPRAA